MSSNPYGIGTSQASQSAGSIEDALQEIQTALQKALTAINQHRADIAQLEQQSQTQGGSPQ